MGKWGNVQISKKNIPAIRLMELTLPVFITPTKHGLVGGKMVTPNILRKLLIRQIGLGLTLQ